ncbi:hypothetical protein Scep_005139 [Stephania cephalantha]|uniref:Uncharacterized protein n=1 Tax=Stephania cephalantha TaxID=152367 RepID=A0AAP0KWA8_9MAGN
MLSTKLAKGDSPSSCNPLEVKEQEWNEFMQVRRSLEWKKKIKENSPVLNYNSSFSIKDDLLRRVLGPKHPGSVRGLGFGVTSLNINAQLQVASWKQAMNNKMNEVMKRQNVMEQMISQLTASMGGVGDRGETVRGVVHENEKGKRSMHDIKETKKRGCEIMGAYISYGSQFYFDETTNPRYDERRYVDNSIGSDTRTEEICYLWDGGCGNLNTKIKLRTGCGDVGKRGTDFDHLNNTRLCLRVTECRSFDEQGQGQGDTKRLPLR